MTAARFLRKAISERPEGYVIKGTGEVVAYSDKRLKNSPDGEYHWCSVSGADDTRTICLFVPPPSLLIVCKGYEGLSAAPGYVAMNFMETARSASCRSREAAIARRRRLR